MKFINVVHDLNNSCSQVSSTCDLQWATSWFPGHRSMILKYHSEYKTFYLNLFQRRWVTFFKLHCDSKKMVYFWLGQVKRNIQNLLIREVSRISYQLTRHPDFPTRKLSELNLTLIWVSRGCDCCLLLYYFRSVKVNLKLNEKKFWSFRYSCKKKNYF